VTAPVAFKFSTAPHPPTPFLFSGTLILKPPARTSNNSARYQSPTTFDKGKMRTCHILRCLSVTLSWQSAQCIGSHGRSFVDKVDVSPAHQFSQPDEQHRWRRDTSFSFKLGQPPQTEDVTPTDDSSHSTDTDDPKTRTDDFFSDFFITSAASDSDPSPTSSTPFTSAVRTATKITPSIARITVISTALVTSTPSSTDTPVPTTSAISKSNSKPFQMSAASIAAAAVLCCFVCIGAAIMLFYRFRRYRAQQKSHQWTSLAPDSHYDGGTKSFGNSRTSSGMSARENIMFHPERRKSASATSMYSKQPVQTVTEQESPYDYVVDPTDIPMGDIELIDEADRSPVSPLLVPAFPRPISSNTQNRDRQSLRREFSFENKSTPPIHPPRESRSSRRSAFSSNPPADWPLAMPTYYGRGFPPQPSPEYQPAPAAPRRNSSGWDAVVSNRGFEDVQTRGGYSRPGQ
jgi:hypothetical protein